MDDDLKRVQQFNAYLQSRWAAPNMLDLLQERRLDEGIKQLRQKFKAKWAGKPMPKFQSSFELFPPQHDGMMKALE